LTDRYDIYRALGGDVTLVADSFQRNELPVKAAYATVLFSHRRYLLDEALWRFAETHFVSATGVFYSIRRYQDQ